MYYVLECQECEPHMDMPFPDEESREKWATAHAESSGHTFVFFRSAGFGQPRHDERPWAPA